MARDYQGMLRDPRGVFVPRWLLIVFALLLVGLALRSFLTAPQHELQRLDSPDGRYGAVLNRVRHVGLHFAIEVRSNIAWKEIYLSPRIDYDPTTDLHERLLWSDDSTRLYFTLRHQLVFGYDLSAAQALSPARINADIRRFPALQRFRDPDAPNE